MLLKEYNKTDKNLNKYKISICGFVFQTTTGRVFEISQYYIQKN